MRLQVSIQRNALPSINIIFTTGSGPASKTCAPNATVTDLLYDVNDLVPLESADGEWGLEDYVVEIQASQNQRPAYECLHYQTINSVFRENDLVVIRSLGTEDLRRRRLGGRHQISADGRHLIDGVAFGRQWLRKGGRPAVNIPPRKRRRLEIEDSSDEDLDEESTTLLGQLKQIGYNNGDIGDDDDDDDHDADDDADFQDDGDDDEELEESSEEADDHILRIKATADFDTADHDEDNDSEELSEDDEDVLLAGAGLELSDELKALLAEADELSEHETYHRLPSEVAQSPRKGKRKRDDEELQDYEQGTNDDTEFEGFPTPTKPFGASIHPSSSVPSAPVLDDDLTSSDSSSDSVDDDDSSRASDTSSSGSSGSEDSSSNDSSDSESDEETSSSGSSSSNSSSGGDMTLKEINVNLSSPTNQKLPKSSSAGNTSSESSLVSKVKSAHKQPPTPPGDGLKITHKNNFRSKKRARLVRLKLDGLLPSNANFADLAAFEDLAAAQEQIQEGVETEADNDLESKRAALLQQLDVEKRPVDESILELPPSPGAEILSLGTARERRLDTNVNVTAKQPSMTDAVNLSSVANDSASPTLPTKGSVTAEGGVNIDESVPSQEIGASAQESFIGKATPKSTERRAKLDLASTRRMLFGSLGLKNPKTPEAEQALREKLAKDIVKPFQRKSDEIMTDPPGVEALTANEMDSWKDKIVLSAVECEYEGVSLSTPPFPFKQGWDSNANMRRGATKKKGRKQTKYYDDSEEHISQYAPDMSTLQDSNQDTTFEQDDRPESRTLSLEELGTDDIPRPQHFQNLTNLFSSDLVPGAVVAFKELDIQNFQPVVSEYRVARVRHVEAGDPCDAIELVLSKKDWPIDRSESDPFAMDEAYTQPEDGVRVKRFADLIEPKLVESSTPIQVSATPAEAAIPMVQNHGSSNLSEEQGSIVPESEDVSQAPLDKTQHQPKNAVMTHVEISTPRRKEITTMIKDAGFDSAIDKDLLHPELELELEPEAQSSPAFHTRSHRSQRSNRSPAPSNDLGNPSDAQGLDDQSHATNGKESNPVAQSQGLSGLLGPSTSTDRPAVLDSVLEAHVSYPALTQFGLDVSGVTVSRESSFQDAQRVSQPPDLDISTLQPDLDTSKLHPEYPFDDFGDDETQQSPATDGAQAQCPHSSPKENADKPTPSSFLGHFLDGQASSDVENDFASDNSSLPGLRDLTSSQNNKIKHGSRPERISRSVAKSARTSISPPAIRGKRLRNGKKHSASPSSESDDGVELPPVKMSQSQASRMSQIEPGSQVIDLTFSSPTRSGNDEEYQAPKTRGSKAKPRNTRATRSQSNESVSFEDHVEDDIPVGIGKKRFLTTKRWSSRSHV